MSLAHGRRGAHTVGERPKHRYQGMPMKSQLSALALLTALGGLTSPAAAADLEEPGAFYGEAGSGIIPEDRGPFAIGWKTDVDIYDRRPRSPTMEVFYPSLPDGSFDDSGGPYPMIFFVQGGLVLVEDYFFLAEHLTSWGFVVALAHYPRDLAIYNPDLTLAALDRLEAAGDGNSFLQGGLDITKVGVGGHSLGGVVADMNIDVDPRFDALLMMDTYPGDENGAEFPGATLFVAGLDECGATNEEKYAGFNTYDEPRAWAGVDGMSHYQFTASDEEDAGECAPAIPIELAHEHLFSVTIPFVRSVLADDDTLFEHLLNPNEGIEVELDW